MSVVHISRNGRAFRVVHCAFVVDTVAFDRTQYQLYVEVFFQLSSSSFQLVRCGFDRADLVNVI